MLTRRNYLKTMALGIMALPIPAFPAAQTVQSENRHDELVRLARELLVDWCQGMLTQQVHHPGDPTSHGALWSPGDGRVLGRAADAAYPFLWYAHTFQDARYIDAAVNVVNWSLENLSLPDGSWKNGLNDNWKGITVFTSTSLAEAIHYHGSVLGETIKDRWLERLRAAGQWLYRTINIGYANINYPVANAYAMSALGRLLDDPVFTNRGRELAHESLAWFSGEDVFLYGESRVRAYDRSPKGCYPIDLGYNVEESLPALVLYGLREQDEVVLTKVTESLKVHLEFMLPDGGWDNSWGIRNHKWTWWGSRTSDGCQPAYALLADRHPAFLEAAYRNTALLRNCTKNGVLYGGPHYIARGIKPSLHHTTCHAKALTTMLNSGIPSRGAIDSMLPRERAYGVRSYVDIDTHLVSHGPWRATVTGYDFPHKRWNASHASGGALSLLWHDRAGPLIAASMSVYKPIEYFDMQKEEGPGFGTLTPRLELIECKKLYFETVLDRVMDWSLSRDPETKRYMNILDFGASVRTKEVPGGIVVETRARVVDDEQHSPESGEIQCSINYMFTTEKVSIEVTPGVFPKGCDLAYIVPLVSEHRETIRMQSDGSIRIGKGNYAVVISSNQAMDIPDSQSSRIFNYTPGFEAVPIVITLKKRLTLDIRVSAS